jgi:hypothetical protein
LTDEVNRSLGKVAATRRSDRLTARDLVGQIGTLVSNDFGGNPCPQKPASIKSPVNRGTVSRGKILSMKKAGKPSPSSIRTECSADVNRRS